MDEEKIRKSQSEVRVACSILLFDQHNRDMLNYSWNIYKAINQVRKGICVIGMKSPHTN
jgi:hypothetical protein